MGLSDAGVRFRKTNLIYPNHRLPSLTHRRRDPHFEEPQESNLAPSGA